MTSLGTLPDPNDVEPDIELDDELKECIVYIAMNEHGDFIVTEDETNAIPDLTSSCGGTVARVVKVVVTMSPPVIDEVSVTVPTTAGTVKSQ
jgi:hypothetical protein